MRIWARLSAAILAVAVTACSEPVEEPDGALTPMPEALTNNAVAGLEVDGRQTLFSFSGLGAGKTHNDVTSSAYAYDIGSDKWTKLPDVPGDKHRLASVAVGLHDRVFIFGGYTVKDDGTEISTPEVYAFNPLDNTYQPCAPMPVPVDDTVAFSYANRYIYLVSGWHDTGNVSDVQVLDTWEDKWFAATPYPGAPVFGHAGGIVAGRIIIADGVKVTGVVDGRRQFGISDEAWMGVIDEDDPAIIRWQALPPHPGKPLYRMAATGSEGLAMVVFAGGSENPYNYNGTGYDGVPSKPSDRVFAFDPEAGWWLIHDAKPKATMDHRGLLEFDDLFYTIGGMRAGQEVTSGFHALELMPVD